MTDTAPPRIKGYHAHVYYDAATLPQARALCEAAAQRFPLLTAERTIAEAADNDLMDLDEAAF